MSNRKSIPELEAEYLLRKMQFWASDKCAYPHDRLKVNMTGGISSKNPILLNLISKGHVKLVRIRNPYRKCHTRYSFAELQTKVDNPNDTCPGCGVVFVYRVKDSTKYWTETVVKHANDCPLTDWM